MYTCKFKYGAQHDTEPHVSLPERCGPVCLKLLFVRLQRAEDAYAELDPAHPELRAIYDPDLAPATAARQGLELAATAPLPEALDKVILPSEPLSTDREYQESCKQTLGSFFHQIGTCSMMPQEDGGVVDRNLIVYGTKNLWVVDASILPLHFSGNIQWTVYAVAERAVDIIRSQGSYLEFKCLRQNSATTIHDKDPSLLLP